MRLFATPLTDSLTWPEPRRAVAVRHLAPALYDATLDDGRSVRTLLDEPDLIFVTTGQQAGLFTGPLYTIHKALSAAALAATLQERWRRPVRALFWVPGDDHDFDEIAAAHWLDANGALRTVRLPARPASAPLRPMWREPLGKGSEAVVQTFLTALPSGPQRDRVANWLGRHYTSQATVAGAYGAALAELLAPFGVVVLDSTHPAVKQATAPLMIEALDRAAEFDRLLLDRAAELEAAGQDVPMELGDGASLVFLDDRHGRDRLVRQEQGFLTRRGRDRYSMVDLKALAKSEPTRLSPNVLLRPIIESALIPTAAYVAGPGELRYLALLPSLYAALNVPRQLPVPRWSGAIIESHVDRILAKFHASPAEMLADPAGLERRILMSQLPEGLQDALQRLRRANDEAYPGLRTPLLSIDPTLDGPWASARRMADWAARDLERKALARLRAREAVELGQLARVRGALLPRGMTPQERVLNVAPFLARHGPGLLTEIHDAAEQWYSAALERDPAHA